MDAESKLIADLEAEVEFQKDIRAAQKQMIQKLRAQHEEFLLKHAKEQNVLLTSLEAAIKEIEQLKEAYDIVQNHLVRAEQLLRDKK